jgi:hypothetical protein
MELENSEKEYIRELSNDYRRLHSKIGEVEEMMKDFSKKAQDLLEELESKRDEENEFLSALSEKYGPGYIDVFTLSWKKGKKDEGPKAGNE